jgi:hypothetical protein
VRTTQEMARSSHWERSSRGSRWRTAAAVLFSIALSATAFVGMARADGPEAEPPDATTTPAVTGHDTTFDNIAPARSANEQPSGGGYRVYPSYTCGASGEGFSDPQWVLVGGSDAPVTLKGQVTSSKIATDDNPIDHHSRDRNFFVYPDDDFAHLLANPGNFVTGAGNEIGRIEVEWESAAFAAWALPMAGDRVQVEGSHIWDCAHSDYRTEIHPARLVMTLRDAANQAWSKPCQVGPNAPNCINGTVTIPARPGWTDTLPGLGSMPVPVTRADVFASSDGGEAREQETCFAPPQCVPADWYQPLKSKSYDLWVPAPPQPDPNAQMVTKLIPRPFLTCDSDDGLPCGSEDVLASEASRFTFTQENGPNGPGVHIHVNFDNFTEPATHLYGFGFTYEVGWNRPATFVPRRVKVTILGVHIEDTLEPTDGEDGEFEISALIGDTFRHLVLTPHAADAVKYHEDVPDTSGVNVGDWGVESSSAIPSECGLKAASGADPGPCQTSFEVTLLPGQPLRVFLRAEEQDTTSTNDEAGTVERITTELQNYGIPTGQFTDWFQERTSAGFDDLDEDCGVPNPKPCVSVTYKIEDDPIPVPPLTTVSASPSVVLNGDTWVTSKSNVVVTATAPGQSNDLVEIHNQFWRTGTTPPPETICDSGVGTATCMLHLNSHDGADGTYTVDYSAVDAKTGAVGPLQSSVFKLDNTPPTTSTSLTGTLVRGWYDTPVTVAFSATDGNGVGVDHTSYNVDGSQPKPYSGPFIVSGDNAAHDVLVLSVDKLLNTEQPKTTDFKIDTTAPVLKISGASDGTFTYSQAELLDGLLTNASSLSVAYAASDNLSGVYAVRLDGVNVASPSGTVSVALPGGISTHTLAVEDVAGNVTPITFSVVSVPLGAGPADPQGAGFWKNAVSNASYSSADLGTFLAEVDLASRAFGTPDNRYAEATVANYLTYLTTTANDGKDLQVRKELLAAWLNLVSGREPTAQTVDLKSVQGWSTVVTDTGGPSVTTALNVVREVERRLEQNPADAQLDLIQTLLQKLNAGQLNK